VSASTGTSTAGPFQRALVLTAGLGTRLRPLTLARAKAAVPVDGEPLASRVIRWLAASGVRDLVLNLHHKPDTITGTIGDGSSLGVRVRYSWETPVLGSAGGPRRALPLLVDGLDPAPPLLFVNGAYIGSAALRADGPVSGDAGVIVLNHGVEATYSHFALYPAHS